MTNNKDFLLNWLQEFYVNKLPSANFPKIADQDIIKDELFSTHKRVSKFSINTVSNPGWRINFNISQTKYQNHPWNKISIGLDEDHNWLFVTKRDDCFDTASGPIYLSVALEAFRCFIEGEKLIINDLESFRAKLKKDNYLLCWLEEFYQSFCNEDWEHLYGCNLITVKDGWVMAFAIEGTCYEEKFFERTSVQEENGIVECYTTGGHFIIRAHPGGLITGIRIFKEWIEKLDIELPPDWRLNYKGG